MNRIGFLLLVGAAALAALAAQQAAAATNNEPDFLPTLPQDQQDAAVNTVAAQSTPENRLAAFLALIRQFEARGRYDILYGGGAFSDYSTHPNVRVPFHNPRKPGDGNNDFSTAAGAYQINFPTYTDFAGRLGVNDFSPETQNAIATAILKQSGAYDAIIAGDIPGALQLASKRWASLPGSTAGQNPQSQITAMATFDKWLATITG